MCGISIHWTMKKLLACRRLLKNKIIEVQPGKRKTRNKYINLSLVYRQSQPRSKFSLYSSSYHFREVSNIKWQFQRTYLTRHRSKAANLKKKVRIHMGKKCNKKIREQSNCGTVCLLDQH